MKGFLLDTCALSEPIKPAPNLQFLQWLRSHEDERGISDLYISVLSLGEIQKGISRIQDPKRQKKFHTFLAATTELFQGRTLDVDSDSSVLWGDIDGVLTSQGNHLSAIDGLIVATAIRHSLTIVTRNVADFIVVAEKYQSNRYDMSHLFINPWE
jgi:toxin FitB